MIHSLELPYSGGLAAAKAFLNEIGLIPMIERERWPLRGDKFTLPNGKAVTFVEWTSNEVQEPFYIFRGDSETGAWFESMPAGHNWSYEEAEEYGYVGLYSVEPKYWREV